MASIATNLLWLLLGRLKTNCYNKVYCKGSSDGTYKMSNIESKNMERRNTPQNWPQSWRNIWIAWKLCLLAPTTSRIKTILILMQFIHSSSLTWTKYIAAQLDIARVSESREIWTKAAKARYIEGATVTSWKFQFYNVAWTSHTFCVS